MFLGRDGNVWVSKASRQTAVWDLEWASYTLAPLIICLYPALLRGLSGRPVHCGMVSIPPGLYSLDTTNKPTLPRRPFSKHC